MWRSSGRLARSRVSEERAVIIDDPCVRKLRNVSDFDKVYEYARKLQNDVRL